MSEHQYPERELMLNSAAGYLIHELEVRGITATPVITEHGHALDIDGRGTLSLENLTDQLQELPMQEWEDTLQRWLQFAITAAQADSAPQPSREELLTMIRTRIISKAEAESYEYGRPFGNDLLQVLCLDYPTHVATLQDESVAKLEIPVDALFAQGQRNTNAEPIDEFFEEDSVHFANGESMFIASKIGDVHALLQQLEIEAPDGLLLAVPNRSLLMYSLPTRDECLTSLIPIAQLLNTLTPEAGFNPPGGMLGRNVYYWAPDGTFEPQIGNYQEFIDDATAHGHNLDTSEEQALVLSPGPKFTERFMKDAS